MTRNSISVVLVVALVASVFITGAAGAAANSTTPDKCGTDEKLVNGVCYPNSTDSSKTTDVPTPSPTSSPTEAPTETETPTRTPTTSPTVQPTETSSPTPAPAPTDGTIQLGVFQNSKDEEVTKRDILSQYDSSFAVLEFEYHENPDYVVYTVYAQVARTITITDANDIQAAKDGGVTDIDVTQVTVPAGVSKVRASATQHNNDQTTLLGAGDELKGFSDPEEPLFYGSPSSWDWISYAIGAFFGSALIGVVIVYRRYNSSGDIEATFGGGSL